MRFFLEKKVRFLNEQINEDKGKKEKRENEEIDIKDE